MKHLVNRPRMIIQMEKGKIFSALLSQIFSKINVTTVSTATKKVSYSHYQKSKISYIFILLECRDPISNEFIIK